VKPKFQIGDKVVVIKKHLSSPFPYGSKHTIVNNCCWELQTSWVVKVENGDNVNENHFILEEIFNSPLYQTMKEEDEI
jgi:hypothetical protein